VAELPFISARYQLDALIGEGAAGAVFHGRDLLLDEVVAVKVVRRAMALHRRFRARFTREVATAARVPHPNLVPLRDWGRCEDGRPFVSMAFAEGGNLASLLGRNPSLDELVHLLNDVLDALGAIHARGMVHQDLKPQNVLLHTAAEGGIRAWVSDLGEANSLLSLVQDRREVGGTESYMAPEQLAADAQEMGPWTDLYAVGLMLYEALCGRPPHTAEGRRELLQQRLDPPPPATTPDGAPLPAALEAVLENLLDPEPRQRYDRAADARRALERALVEVGTGVRLKPLRRRRPVQEALSTGPVLPTGEAPFSGVLPRQDTTRGVPRWNQVPPSAMPERPPPPEGRHGELSVSLCTLRDLPLVARDAERQRLWDLAREVFERSEPRVVLIVGDSGTGKTRLVESIAQNLEEGGFMETVGLRYHAPPTLEDGYRGAVQEILCPWYSTRRTLARRLTRWLARDRQAPPETVAAEAEILARWCGHLEVDEAPVNAAVGLAYLYRHLDARAWRGGAALILDDVHRASVQGDGLDIARALLDGTVGERPVFVMATLSAEAARANPAITRRIERLVDRGATLLSLAPLDLEATRLLLRETLPLEEDLADAIAVTCVGNPLAVRLLLQDWAHRGYLVEGANRRVRLAEELRPQSLLPSRIEQLYRSSLQAAVQAGEDPEATAEALAVLALAGPEAPLPVVRAGSEVGLDSLLASGVVRIAGNHVVFEHGVVERTARELAAALPDAWRIHAEIAAAWRALGETGTLDVDFYVGSHEWKAGEAEDAAGRLIRSARQLHEQGLAGHSLRVARFAFEAAEASGSAALRQEARRRLAEILVDTRDFVGAEELLHEALVLDPMDRLLRARIALLQSRVAMGRGDLASARKALEQAVGPFTTFQDREGLLDVAHGRAVLERQAGDPRGAARHFREALRHLRRDPRREVLLLSGLIEALLMSGEHRDIEGYRQRLVQVARESGDTRNLAQSSHTVGIINLCRRRLDVAERSFQTSSALSSTLGAHQLHLNCQNSLGEVARFRGQLDVAARHYRKFAEYAEEEGMMASAAVGHVNLAMVALSSRDYRALESCVRNAARCVEGAPAHWVRVPISLLGALLAATRGDELLARARLDEAMVQGLANLRSADLYLPLHLLAEHASSAGWSGLAQSAARLAIELGEGPDGRPGVDFSGT
jgi:serine/threonine protein kinase/tetratricopeptide (TPR) repeat protein